MKFKDFLSGFTHSLLGSAVVLEGLGRLSNGDTKAGGTMIGLGALGALLGFLKGMVDNQVTKTP